MCASLNPLCLIFQTNLNKAVELDKLLIGPLTQNKVESINPLNAAKELSK